MGLRSNVAKSLSPKVPAMAPGLNHSFIQQALKRALSGVGPLASAADAAEEQLREKGGDVDAAIGELIENHCALAAAQGFVTNLGGLVTMAATVPVNISGLAVLQTRLIAGIAHLRGYDLDDPRVRSAVLVCLLGADEIKDLVKDNTLPGSPMVIATAPAYDEKLSPVISSAVSSALISRVIGKRAAGTIVRRVPVAGGVWGASADGFATWQIGRYAKRELRSRIVPRPAH